MGDTTPNMSIFVPSSGEELYRSSFASGQNRIDQHRHTGAPTGGLPLISDSYTDGSITPNKLSNQVRQSSGYIANYGMSYSNGVFAVTSSDGSALSTSNRAYANFQSKTNPGQLVLLNQIVNQSFEDAASGSSDIAGNLFGRASGVDSTQDVQFYLYAVMNDAMNAIQTMICPLPCQEVSPPASKIGTPTSPNANSDDSFFSLGNITATDFDGNPCVELGCFRMRKTGGVLNDWTVQGLNSSDGIGACNCNQDEIDVPGESKMPGWQNLGFVYSAGFFQVTDAEGNPLNATNKASVTLSSNVLSSALITVDVTSNLGFRDSTNASGSDIADNLFGTQDDATAPISPRGWIYDMPWFVYAVLNDAGDGVGFAVSRNPCEFVAPASSDMGTIGLANADTQYGFYFLARDASGNNIIPTATPSGTPAAYLDLFDGNPCICLGGIRVKKVVSTDNDWTVQALSFSKGDGVGNYHEASLFQMPPGVNGASIGTYVLATPAMTSPIWQTQNVYYTLNRDGYINHRLDLQDATTPGSGVADLQIVLPYKSSAISQFSWGFGVFTDASASGARVFTAFLAPLDAITFNQLYFSGGTGPLNYSSVAASDSLQSDIWLKVFDV